MPEEAPRPPRTFDPLEVLKPYIGAWEGDPSDSRVDNEGKFARASTQFSLFPVNGGDSELVLNLTVKRTTHYIETLPDHPVFAAVQGDGLWPALSEQELAAQQAFTMEVRLEWKQDAQVWNAHIQGLNELYTLRSSQVDDLSKGGLVIKPQGDETAPNSEKTLCIHPVEIQASPHGAGQVGFFTTVKDFQSGLDYTFAMGRLYPADGKGMTVGQITQLGTPFEQYMKRLGHRGVWSGNVDVIVRESGAEPRELRVALELAILPHPTSAAIPGVSGPHRVRVICFLPTIVDGPPRKRKKKTSSTAKCRNTEDLGSIEGIMDGVMERRGSRVVWVPAGSLETESAGGEEVWLDLRTLQIPGPYDKYTRSEKREQYALAPPSLFVMWTGSHVNTPILRGALTRPQGGWIEFGTPNLATGLEPDPAR